MEATNAILSLDFKALSDEGLEHLRREIAARLHAKYVLRDTWVRLGGKLDGETRKLMARWSRILRKCSVEQARRKAK